ncbi:MAG TPA: hypothetical protein ENH33_01925 [Actinobacteria bacterium]|nr:hypothetical protein [Actinomycetota bacterium]
MNARRPLNISSYDGSGQNVHPDVAQSAEGLHGFRLWMVCTPYPRGDDRLENPAIRVSNDGITWLPFPGAPDPLVVTPIDPDTHNADPDLVIVDSRLHVFFMTRNKREQHTTFSMIWSDDGRTWSEPVVVYEGTWGVSPAVAYHDGMWRMWFIVFDASNKSDQSHLVVRSGPKPTTLGDQQRCSLIIPGHVPWHLDLQRCEDGRYEALVAAYPVGSDNAHTRLFHCSSVDGLAFDLTQPKPILKPSIVGWDAMMIYRSTFVKSNGIYHIWYTGGSWNRRFGIGHVSGTLCALRPTTLPIGIRLDGASQVVDNAIGFAKYLAKRHMPRDLIDGVRRLAR